MRLKKVNLKRVLCALLASAMVVVPVTPASAATARATTMKLEKAEGSVTLKTQNGSARKITNGMRLYNGNALSTASSSYAYISLDSTKAVKLDQNSSATLRQSGGQLELLVKSGKLFFNVSKPLTQKENMNVRTSTMVTGIRGTCGVVEYVNVNKSRLYLLEGKVTLGSGENATTIYGGQTATVILQPKKESGGTDQPGESDKPGDTDKPDKEVEQKVLVEKMTEKTVPVFAIAEIVSDPVLQKKITKTTDLKIEKLEEILEASKQEEEEKEPEKTPEETTPSGGGSSAPSTPVVTDATLTGNVSAAAINAALATYNKVTIAADAKAELEADVKIPEGKVLLVNSEVASNSGKINVGDGTMITTTNVASNVVSDNSALLCTCTSGSTDGSSVYASTLNVQVAEYLNGLAQTSAVTATFEKDAKVTSSIALSGSGNGISLSMEANSMVIESGGTLTLNSNVGITGSGSATVQLNGGNLAMQGTSTLPLAVIENTEGSCAIAHTSGTVKWTDKGMRVVATGADSSNAGLAIQGTTLNDDKLTAIKPPYVTIAGGALEWNAGTLSFLPSEFVDSSEWVSVHRINAALKAYPTVTVGVGLALNSNDTITIPEGKTLNIESKVTSEGPPYSGGISMAQGSKITVADGATLNVSGGILGNGTINVGTGSGTSKAKMEVTEGGRVIANTIQLCSTSNLINSGTIDIGGMISSGSAAVTNNSLIKITNGAYTSQNQGTDTYIGSASSALISDYESTAIKQHALMFATHVSNDTVKQCYYASSINDLVVKYMNELTKETTDATIKWVFKNNVLVPAGKDITLTNFSADTGIYALQVAGDLTLTNIGTITGSGKSVIHLSGAGTLTLDGATATTRYITNTYAGTVAHYVISVDEYGTNRVKWNDVNLRMKSDKNEYIIRGYGQGGSTSNVNYVNYATNYLMSISDGEASLSPTDPV